MNVKVEYDRNAILENDGENTFSILFTDYDSEYFYPDPCLSIDCKWWGWCEIRVDILSSPYDISPVDFMNIATKCEEIRIAAESVYELLGCVYDNNFSVEWRDGMRLISSNNFIKARAEKWIRALHQKYFELTDVEKIFAEQDIAEYKNRQNRSGWVYLLRSVSGHYKIGRAKNPENRLETFSVKLPFEVEYEHLIASDDYITLEKNLHERFSHCHVNGEWFSLSNQDVDFIKSLRGMK